MFVRGKGEFRSPEGPAQDPVVMGLYALGITPLVTAVRLSLESERHFHNNSFYDATFEDDFKGCKNLRV